ncbi:hypothetical protein ACGFU4_36070 [Streptomyces sp. NPDC048511]|uniref:hypothetical protein n=1 Tax=Streptomyces sp. NPDC048511 TaxID=3365562 RepID=UPI00370FF140
MAAQLKGTVYVTDPDTHQTVELAPGTSPDPRYAALVTNPAAWVDGKLPRLPKTKTETEGDSSLFGSGQDDASGGASAASDTADPKSDDEPPTGDDSEDTKPAARKTAAKKPARGRTTAAEGTGGQ